MSEKGLYLGHNPDVSMVKGFQERADALSQLGGRDHDLSRPSGNVSGRVEKKKETRLMITLSRLCLNDSGVCAKTCDMVT